MTSQNNSLPNVSLADIKSPEDLKGLSIAQLESLAQQIRDELCRLIETRSVHIASNMGVVELTLALHTVLISPKIGSSGTSGIKRIRIKW